MYRNKKNTTVAIIALSLLISVGSAWGQGEIIEDVKNALKSGSSKELVKFLNQNVDVTLNGNIQNYSRVQAEYVLKDFFNKNQPTGFTIIHQGASKGGLHFAIGQYTSETSKYRVFIRIKNTNGKNLVHEISFDEE